MEPRTPDQQALLLIIKPHSFPRAMKRMQESHTVVLSSFPEEVNRADWRPWGCVAWQEAVGRVGDSKAA